MKDYLKAVFSWSWIKYIIGAAVILLFFIYVAGSYSTEEREQPQTYEQTEPKKVCPKPIYKDYGEIEDVIMEGFNLDYSRTTEELIANSVRGEFAIMWSTFLENVEVNDSLAVAIDSITWNRKLTTCEEVEAINNLLKFK